MLPPHLPCIQVDPQPRHPAPADGPGASATDSPFVELLHRQAQAATFPRGNPPALGRVLLGRLQALPSGGQPGLADVPGLGLLQLWHSLVPWAPEQIGKGVALSLMAPGQALLLGMVWDATVPTPLRPDAAAADPPPLAIMVDGRRRVVEAEQELELRCGDAAILLSADGRIQLRGTYITSHASATQRIVGGSVHVN